MTTLKLVETIPHKFADGLAIIDEHGETLGRITWAAWKAPAILWDVDDEDEYLKKGASVADVVTRLKLRGYELSRYSHGMLVGYHAGG